MRTEILTILLAAELISLGMGRANGQTASQAQRVTSKEDLSMPVKTVEAKQAKVEDVGGVFIYTNDPKTLAEWYKDKLGIELVYNADEGNYYYVFVRSKVPGANAVFAIKPAKSRLSTEKNQFMINFRINDFDSFIKRLKERDVAIDRTEDYPGFGRFGWIKDLEGNPIEFWQPTK